MAGLQPVPTPRVRGLPAGQGDPTKKGLVDGPLALRVGRGDEVELQGDLSLGPVSELRRGECPRYLSRHTREPARWLGSLSPRAWSYWPAKVGQREESHDPG